MEIKETAKNLNLAKTLDATFLQSLSLDDLKIVNRILIERASAVFGGIAALKARDEFSRSQFQKGMFRSEHKLDDGTLVFNYSCEPRFAEDNLFVPGKWFQQFLDEFAELEAKHQENSTAFPKREKARLIEKLLGSSAQAAVSNI